jgi:hypothetical protein
MSSTHWRCDRAFVYDLNSYQNIISEIIGYDRVYITIIPYDTNNKGCIDRMNELYIDLKSKELSVLNFGTYTMVMFSDQAPFYVSN